MKRIWTVRVIVWGASIVCGMLLVLWATGCAMSKTAKATAPLAPGITSQADGNVNSAVMSLHGALIAGEAYQQLHADAMPSAFKGDFNLLVTAANIVDATFVSYQRGAATQAQMQTALNNASALQTKVFADVTGGVK